MRRSQEEEFFPEKPTVIIVDDNVMIYPKNAQFGDGNGNNNRNVLCTTDFHAYTRTYKISLLNSARLKITPLRF